MSLHEFWNGAWAGALPAEVVNHLWQSTVVVGIAWLLALALRKNHARTRYWVWMVASLKFLVPFSVLMDLGAWLRSLVPVHMVAGPQVATVIQQVAQPFARGTVFESANYATAAVHRASVWPFILLAIWAGGAGVVAIRWALDWRRLQRIAREAKPASSLVLPHSYPVLGFAADLPVLCSEELIEPGIFGVFRPVLLMPEGIVERLTAEQLSAIVAHEMCHVRRRDNLTFTLHMIVEGLFWFYPLVWWIGARLLEERERACDEAVVQAGNQAEIYAEGILKVCKFYVEAPVACAAGVTGSDLKKRIVRIISNRAALGLDLRRRVLLGAAGLLALALPLVLGVMHVGAVIAETRAEDELANLPKFDVASIKPHKDEAEGMMRMGFGVTPDGIHADGVPAAMIVRQAFGVSDDRILNEPDWLRSSRYDVEAKVSPEDASKLKGLTQRQRNIMLLPVLEDRFALKFHHETRELDVYTLVIAKNGPKLKAAQPEQAGNEGPPPIGPGGADPGPAGAKRGEGGGRGGPQTWMRMSSQGMTLEGRGVTMETLANTLSRELGATVIDKTGLTYKYDYTLKFMSENGTNRQFDSRLSPPPPSGSRGEAATQNAGPESAPEDMPPPLLSAIQEQLGLKLVRQKEPVDVIVIDQIQQPSPN
jgi:bla regulator protein BlaR1